MNANLLRKAVGSAAAAALASLVAACGGGAEGTGDNTPPVGTASYSSGVMTLGSVIVNGVRYDDTNATVFIDDNTATRTQLRNGMVVKVRGRINDDGVNGTAERIEVENELRGTVTAIDMTIAPPTFTVNGVLVRTDESTVFDGVAGVGALLNQKVEVHGLRDASGNLRASRVEVQNGTGLLDEFKGTITTALSGNTFGIGAITVTLSTNPAATFAPAGCTSASLTQGRVVEVHGGFTATNQFLASRIDCEDLEDDNNGVKPPAGARNEIEGFITEFTADANVTNGSFKIGTVTVTFGGSTQVRNGTRADLANGVRVEVDGTLNGTTLTAREISFKQDRIILQGSASQVTQTTFVVLGQIVQRNSLTDVQVTLNDGTSVEVRARLATGGVLIADEVRNGGSGQREIIQARVTSKSASTIRLLGLDFDLPASGAEYRDLNESLLTRDAFLAAITANPSTGTLVKLRADNGFSFGLTVTGLSQGEIEN